MGFVGGVIWFIKDEGANGIETRRVEVRYCAVYAEPGGDGDEVVVGRGEFVSMGDMVSVVVAGFSLTLTPESAMLRCSLLIALGE